MAKASPFKLPPPKFGVDILSQEGDISAGAVRRAHNVVISTVGGFGRRQGHRLFTALEGAHSLWHNKAHVLVAAKDKLYEVNLDAGSVTPIFQGLPLEQPVSYTEVVDSIYFCAPGVLGKICVDGGIRRPGIAQLLGYMPSLAPTVGGLLPGRYGVAYSLLNDLGEESGVSSIAWIDLPAGGGVLLSGLVIATDVVRMNIYITHPNGTELYLHANLVAGPSASIMDRITSRSADKCFLEPMRGGTVVRTYRGRLYVADGPWLWISEPLDYGLYNVKSGYMIFEDSITMLEPVTNGIFVGLPNRVAWFGGEGPGQFQTIDATKYGAIPYSGASVPADFFDDQMVADRGKSVAAWMSEKGMVVGLPSGAVSYPQVTRVSVVAERARPAFMQVNGIKQALYCGAAFGVGPIDTTF